MPTELGTAHGKIVIDAEVDAASAKLNAFSKQSESSLKAISSAATSLAGAFGITFGAQAIAQFARAAAAADAVAVAYSRQMVAAESLAGSQGALNALLATYDAATGGAVDKATALANVTNLMAQGFADSTVELETFLVGVRGAAIAMGKPQEFIIERAQFEMLNQTGQRLNEIGLSMEEVRAKAANLAQTNKQLTKEQAYQQAVLASLNEKYGDFSKSSEGAVTGVERVTKAWQDLRLEVAQEFHPGFDQLGDATADFLEWIQQRRREIPSEASNLMRGAGIVQPPAGSRARDAGRHGSGGGGGAAAVDSGFSAEANEAMLDWAAERTEIERQANADILDENNSYQRQRADMIGDYEKNLTRSAANYAKQRARSIEDYEKGVARFERDAQAQRLRMAEDHERNMARMREDHAKRLGDLQEDLDTRIAERRAESAERIADFGEDRDEGIAEAREKSAARLLEIEEDYTRDRARAARQHGDTLDEAAANLDAKAVYNEQRRFARENADAEEAHTEKVSDEQKKLDESIKNLNEAYDKKVADEQEALQKSIDQAQTAYNKQVADANEAFAQREQDAIDSYARQAEDFETQHQQRLTDMAGDFADELTQRDNDQIDRINEMKADHQENLTELDTEHGERLTQIGTHAAEERGKLDSEFEKRMGQLTGHEFDLATEQFKHQIRMLDGYQNYLDDVEKEQIKHQIRMLRLLAETPGLTPAELAEINQAITDLGIALGKVGDAATHVDPRVAPVETFPGGQGTLAGMSMLGGQGLIVPAGGTATVSGAGGTAVTIAPGAIVINAAAGASVAGLGDEFERRLLEVLKKVGNVGVR